MTSSPRVFFQNFELINNRILMINNEDLTDTDDCVQEVNTRNLSAVLHIIETENDVQTADMTSLKNFLLFNETENNEETDNEFEYLSLAYERLHALPKVMYEIAPFVKILDISHNEFENINFVGHFKNLTTLICDNNKISSDAEIPYLPNLELLWMNKCKITSLNPWAYKLQLSCPNLKYLSLINNPGIPSCFSRRCFYDYLQYRYFMLSLFPDLVHLDDRKVTDDQREESEKLYGPPFSKGTNYFLTMRDKIRSLFVNVPEVIEGNSTNLRNVVI